MIRLMMPTAEQCAANAAIVRAFNPELASRLDALAGHPDPKGSAEWSLRSALDDALDELGEDAVRAIIRARLGDCQ